MMEEDSKISPALLSALDPATGAPKAPPVGESFVRLQSKMKTATHFSTPYSSKTFPAWRYVSIAAGLLIVIAGVKFLKPEPPKPVTKTYKAAPGQNLSFALDNGARVTLAPGSTLQVTGSNTDLNGEAAFTVNHKADSAFTINAQGYRIAVLGTRFAVRAYDPDIRVAVAEGKVSVGSAILIENEVGYTFGGEIRGMRVENIDRLFLFTTGKLKFNGAVLEDAIPDLERWFDVKIVVKDSALAEEPFTATFAQGSRSDLASILKLTFGAKVKQEGRIITLSRQ